jgi:hypothetical protein
MMPVLCGLQDTSDARFVELGIPVCAGWEHVLRDLRGAHYVPVEQEEIPASMDSMKPFCLICL